MPVLIDTHVLVWLLGGDYAFTDESRAAIDQALAESAFYVSAISLWEIALLDAKGRIDLHLPLDEWVGAVERKPGLSIAPLTHRIAAASARLPGRLHADPADRFIVATARALDATLITRDNRLVAYGRHGHLDVLPA